MRHDSAPAAQSLYVRPNRALAAATLVAALGGLLFGFDTIVISGVQQQVKAVFKLDAFLQGFMTASALIGTVIGSLVAGKPGDLYGRRDSLKMAGALYFICAAGCAGAWNLASLVTFRLVGGIAVGASSVLGPAVPGGDLAGAVARTVGGIFPVQCRAGLFARVSLQFLHRHTPFRRQRMALEIGRPDGPGSPVPGATLLHPEESALAGDERLSRGGCRRSAPYRNPGRGRADRRHSHLDPSGEAWAS